MSEKRVMFRVKELAVCPHCGEKRGQRHSGYSNAGSVAQQRYYCTACHKTWNGPVPEPPSAPCPYCGGYCKRAGRKTLYEPMPSLLDQWFDHSAGIATERKVRERPQKYQCTVCGRRNTELWQLRMPRKTPDGPYPYQITLWLTLSCVRLLDARCKKKGMNRNQALRDLFRNASYAKRGSASISEGISLSKPPAVESLPRLPRVKQLSDGRRKSRPAGRRTLGPLEMHTVCLDQLAYYGLLRTMRNENMTRQEAARYLVSFINPKG